MWNVQILRKSILKSLNASLTVSDLVFHARDELHSRVSLDTDKEVCLTVQCLRQSRREVSAELSWTVWLELASVLRVSHLHHVARATRRTEIDVAVSQVIQAAAVTDREWLDCWPNFLSSLECDTEAQHPP